MLSLILGYTNGRRQRATLRPQLIKLYGNEGTGVSSDTRYSPATCTGTKVGQVALHFMHYNFCRIHQSLRVTPAMEAGVINTLWDVTDIVRIVEAATAKPGPRGPYKKRISK